jgi:4,5:9,10-diseco-3-hydroxy-5,9,17-trioxoandrosta-1(10),2-diene-4-oate hydrolase
MQLAWWRFLAVLLGTCCHINATSSPLPTTATSYASLLTALRDDPMAAIDQGTLKLMTLITGSKSVQVPLRHNQSVHCLDFPGTGKSPPIVLLHGISSCGSDYFPLIYYLRALHQRVIAIDLPGHGETVANPSLTLPELEKVMIASVSAALRALKVGRCVLCGNSLGGFVAARYCARYPRNVQALVLISPAGAPLSVEELQKVQKLFHIESLGDAVQFLEKVLGRPRLPIFVRRLVGWAVQARLRKPSVKRILQQATIHSSLRPDELAAVKCPVLLIWGEREQVFEESHREWFVRAFDHLERRGCFAVVRPRGMGHVPHMDPLLTTNVIANFLLDQSVV